MKWLVTVGLFRSIFALLLLSLPLELPAQVDSSNIRTGAPSAALARPAYCGAAHNVGKLQFNITNYGRFGVGASINTKDCFTGFTMRQGEYPVGSGTMYLHRGGIWVGGVVGTDTLVSAAVDLSGTAREFNPEVPPFGNLTHVSGRYDSPWYSPEAVSDQDYVAVYTDTLVEGSPYPSFDALTSRKHRPLGLQVRQESYAWSYGYCDDLVLVNCIVTNIGQNVIEGLYFGIYMDMDINRFSFNLDPSMGPEDKPRNWGQDDVTGFIPSHPSTAKGLCSVEDTVNLAWSADNDGDWDRNSRLFGVPNVTGVRFLNEPRSNRAISYNWWVPNYNPSIDFGPQKRDGYRSFSGRSGSPTSDLYKYHVLSNHEIDYPLHYVLELSLGDEEWVYPSTSISGYIYTGGDNHWVLSVGPWTMEPGASISVPFAYVGAENWHMDYYNSIANLTWGYHPDAYMEMLNLDEFATNATWASRIFDNPGVDTDGDGDSGKVRFCVVDSGLVNGEWVPTVIDTTYYAGDGFPDWRAASAPPPPKMWLSRIVGGLRVRFNGYQSETTRDFLSSLLDFEGYRIYLSRDERESSFSLAASYDIENFDAFVYNAQKKPKPDFELSGIPMSLQEVRCRFSDAADPCNDSTFDPLAYTQAHPFRSAQYFDTIVYFATHDYNASKLGVTTDIRKRFPEELRPDPTKPVTPDMLTEDGYLKYYEYECDIVGLLPTIPYWVNVTAFDFGAPDAGLEPLESSRTLGAQDGFAASDGDQVDGSLPPVYVYPNPYRADGKYRSLGYEGYGQFDKIHDRVRAIHFENLPPKCTIRIFTLDGDLVRAIDHDLDPADPTSTHDSWDLVSRNVQMIVSGIYYWAVEEPSGEVQLGKLVIIM